MTIRLCNYYLATLWLFAISLRNSAVKKVNRREPVSYYAENRKAKDC